MELKNSKSRVYVSFEHEAYKMGKAGLLKMQVDLLNCVKHLQNLRKIKEEKMKMKLDLERLFSSVSFDLTSLNSAMPMPAVPNIRRKVPGFSGISGKKTNHEKHDDKIISIESELEEINERLRRLNG